MVTWIRGSYWKNSLQRVKQGDGHNVTAANRHKYTCRYTFDSILLRVKVCPYKVARHTAVAPIRWRTVIAPGTKLYNCVAATVLLCNTRTGKHHTLKQGTLLYRIFLTFTLDCQGGQEPWQNKICSFPFSGGHRGRVRVTYTLLNLQVAH